MSIRVCARGAAVVVACMLFAGSMVSSASAQDKEGAKPAAKEGAKKEKVDPRGPLPQFYRDVVDGIQREKMYSVHASYETQIKEAQAAVRALQQKRDAEIEALLRPDQKERVQQLMKDAKAKQPAKGAAAKEKKPTADKPDAK